MSVAVLLAGVAGVLAARAIVDLAAGWERRSRVRARRARPRLVVLLATAGRRLGPPPASGGLRDRLDAAGAPLAADELVALRAGAGLAGCLAALPLAAGLPPAAGITVVGIAVVCGFAGPELWLRRLAAARGRRIAAELADVADLLRVAVEAGHTVRRALAEVGRRHPGLLAAELRRAADALEFGVPREAAFAALRRRLPDPAAAALLATLERTERLGVAPAPALAALAADARATQRRAVAERAARAAPQVQLVVALLLVPAAMLLVAAALAPALGV